MDLGLLASDVCFAEIHVVLCLLISISIHDLCIKAWHYSCLLSVGSAEDLAGWIAWIITAKAYMIYASRFLHNVIWATLIKSTEDCSNLGYSYQSGQLFCH